MSVIRLIRKDSAEENLKEVANFHPIALTSCIGKVFNTILKNRWLAYMLIGPVLYYVCKDINILASSLIGNFIILVCVDLLGDLQDVMPGYPVLLFVCIAVCGKMLMCLLPFVQLPSQTSDMSWR